MLDVNKVVELKLACFLLRGGARQETRRGHEGRDISDST